MRLIPYVRVSRVGDRSGASFISPDVQVEQIAAKAKLGEHELVGEPITDLDESGGNLARPGWEHAEEMVMRDEADGIIVAKLDRFSRNLLDALEAIERFEKAGKVIVSATDDFDPTTPMGRFARDLVIRLAQMERERIAENWRIARGKAVQRGVRAARAPFGYRLDADKHLVPDPGNAPILREVFERRAHGATWAELCRFLDDEAPRRQGAWPATTVTRMLKLRTYLGEGEGGTRHEAIVDRRMFESAQRGEPVGRFAPNPKLLTGLVHCATCGGVMTRTTDGNGYDVYRCRGRRSVGICPRPARVSVSLADEYVESAFLSLDIGVIRVSEIGEEEAVDAQSIERLELAESELNAYRDETLISVIGVGAYRAGLAQRQQALDEARQAVREQPRPRLKAQSVDRTEDWQSLTIDQQRKRLALHVESVVVKPGHAKNDQRTGRSTIPLAKRIDIRWRHPVSFRPPS